MGVGVAVAVVPERLPDGGWGSEDLAGERLVEQGHAELALALFRRDPSDGRGGQGEVDEAAELGTGGVLHGHRFACGGPRCHYAMTWGILGVESGPPLAHNRGGK